MLKLALSALTLFTFACTTSPHQQNREKKSLRIAIADESSNLDPRKARALLTMNVMHFLYEGLYRPSTGVTVKPGVAQEVSVSEDGVTYTFLLRPCSWSDGIDVSSADFLESWKSTLKPEFGAPNAYQLFCIKNAKAIYEGTKPIEELGVETPNERTLIVHLEEPTAAFLQMTATPPFFPIPHHQINKDSSLPKGERPITNGPYIVGSWRPQCDMTLTKNPKYWATSESLPTNIVTTIVDENTALSLFEKQELDWIGSPLSAIPSDAIQKLKTSKNFRIAPAAGTHFLRVNTKKAPFDDIAVRQTLSQAIQRTSLTEHILQGGQAPAESLLPPAFGVLDNPLGFPQALPQDVFAQKAPSFSLMYIANDRASKLAQALQDQWMSALGIQVTLVPCDSKLFQQKIKSGDFDLAQGSWYADFLDPMNFLAVFETTTNGTNHTGWESLEYQQLLTQSRKTRDEQERNRLQLQADRILCEEAAIIPLYFGAFNFITSESNSTNTITPLGIITFQE